MNKSELNQQEMDNSIMDDLETVDSTKAQQVETASQWQLMIWRFKKHKLAVFCVYVLIFLYGIAIFCEFFAPNTSGFYKADYVLAPPQLPHLFYKGNFVAPFIYGYDTVRDPITLEKHYTLNTDEPVSLTFFGHGEPYKFLGFINSDIHLVSVDKEGVYLYFFGGDEMGRDVFSRIIYGSRISLSIGLVGVTISLFLGILLGGLSGYYGGLIDMLIQRLIEFLKSLPAIPLWLTLAAALPPHWSSIKVYFSITIILSLLGWTNLARIVRGKFLALREEDFILAAELAGFSKVRIIFEHMVPSFSSHLIASLTISIPGMILSETSLSFLGLGITPPAVSWGVLLQSAQNIRVVALAPWLLLPGALVIITVLAFNFVGDGMRDAADPYSK